MLLAGILLSAPWLVQLGLALLLVVGLARLWTRFALRRLRYERRIRPRRVEVGETARLELRLQNDKPLPLAWLRLRDRVPESLEYEGAFLEPSTRPGKRSLILLTALGPYRHMTWRYRVDCPRRGHHLFGPLELRSGDLFGLFETREERPAPDRLVVFPKLRTLPELGFPAGEPFGGRSADRVLNRDPLRPMGLRDYQPGDRLREVHWKASARLPGAGLQVKLLEPVSRPAVLVVLNINTQSHMALGVDPVVQERLISVAASIAAAAARDGHPMGLVANGVVPGSGRPIRLPIGQGPQILPRTLDALAAVGPFVLSRPERLLAREGRRAPWGATLVCVTAVVDEAIELELLRLARAGRRVALVSLDPRYEGRPKGVAVHRIPPEAFALDFSAAER